MISPVYTRSTPLSKDQNHPEENPPPIKSYFLPTSPFISRQVSTAGKSTQPLSLVLSEHSLLESPYFSSCHYPLIKPDTLPLPKTLTLPQSTHSQLFPEKREAIKRELHLQTNNLLTSLHLYLYCLPGSLSFLPQGVASASSLLSFLPTGIFHIFKTK